MSKALAHNTERSGPDQDVPVVVVVSDGEYPSNEYPEAEWHVCSDDEYAAYEAYWDEVYSR